MQLETFFRARTFLPFRAPFSGRVRRLRAALLLCAVSGGIQLPVPAAAVSVSQLIVNDQFGGTPTGPLLYYTPFDPAYGLLDSVRVTVNGSFEGGVMLTPSPPFDMTAMLYTLRIEHTLEAASPARAFGFPSGVPAAMIFSGTSIPFNGSLLSRFFTLEFTASSATDGTGQPLLQAPGMDEFPASIETRREYFIDTPCGDLPSQHSALSFAWLPQNPSYISPSLPVAGTTGSTQIQYNYIPASALSDAVTNGDFESSTVTPWNASGSGTATVTSPSQCLQPGNLLLELADSASAGQPVNTPAAAFDILFDYGFAQAGGQLQLSLGGTTIDTITAASRAPNAFRTRQLHVADPALRAQSAFPLQFTWTGPNGSAAWVDNVRLYSVPEPASALCFFAAALTLGALRLLRTEGIGDHTTVRTGPYTAIHAEPARRRCSLRRLTRPSSSSSLLGRATLIALPAALANPCACERASFGDDLPALRSSGSPVERRGPPRLLGHPLHTCRSARPRRTRPLLALTSLLGGSRGDRHRLHAKQNARHPECS